eukprot:6001049-Pyramimonas_sp.AAC.1
MPPRGPKRATRGPPIQQAPKMSTSLTPVGFSNGFLILAFSGSVNSRRPKRPSRWPRNGPRSTKRVPR